MPDSGCLVAEVCGDVGEPGFLDRLRRGPVELAAGMPGIGAIYRRVRVGRRDRVPVTARDNLVILGDQGEGLSLDQALRRG